MVTRLAELTRDACTNGRTGRFTSGKIRIYSGSQPSTANTAPTGTLLAELTMDATPVGTSSTGTASLNDLPLTVVAGATGTAGYYRIVNSGGLPVEDGACGTSSGEMILSSTSLVSGVAVTITSATFTQPM